MVSEVTVGMIYIQDLAAHFADGSMLEGNAMILMLQRPKSFYFERCIKLLKHGNFKELMKDGHT